MSISRVRAVMLDTALQPYTDIADLFIVDPDGFIIRSIGCSIKIIANRRYHQLSSLIV